MRGLCCIRISIACGLATALLASAVAGEPGPKQWRKLFDGRTLEGWKAANFGGEGEVRVEDGCIEMDFGSPLTGVTYTGQLPQTNYEVRLEAQRLDGIDFFCGLTFPVDQSHCSLIVGGWAGAVVGLSNIDRRDASENETTKYMTLRDNRWYRIRVRVEPDRIQTWIDDEKIIDQDIRGRHISTRDEVDLSKPLGIACYETVSALRNIELRQFPATHSNGTSGKTTEDTESTEEGSGQL
jgi:hypothetical protein